MSFFRDLKIAVRSLWRVPALWITVALTLALGIGANAAIFSVVRAVLLRPLANRDEARLLYVRQSAPGIGVENAAFSVPEIDDLSNGLKTITELGTFSAIDFTIVGLGTPREIPAGVVDGHYFDVMGLRPVLGRLLTPSDDGPNAPGAVVLTYRFWSTSMQSDRGVIGKTLRLESFGGPRSAVIVGVLEPSVPYPAETELIANIVTSPHHLSATMVTGRVHRMTVLFGRLAPGADINQARAELRTAYGSMTSQHPEAYPHADNFQISAVFLREQITAGAKTVLWVLFAASILVFVIACSNAANLILARTVRREGELSIRAALGATTSSLRRTLLIDSLLLCGTGAALGILIASPMVSILARYASRFSVRALDLTVDSSMLWVGAILAVVAAVLLAFVPRLPSAESANGLSLASGGVRITGSTGRRLRVFAVTQIAACFMLLAGAGMLLKTLLALQTVRAGFDTHNVLAINVPVVSYGRTPDQILDFYKETIRQVSTLPGVDRVAVGTAVPWRDKGIFGPGFQFTAQGHVRANDEEDPHAQFRTISPGFFAALGVPIIEGRDFNDLDRKDSEKVVIISQSVAIKMFPNTDALNQHIMWTDPVMKFVGVSPEPRRIVGISADVDDENVVPGATLTVYHPLDQEIGGGRLFVHTHTDPYTLVKPITRIIRDLSVDQPIEKAATLDDVRAEVLTPDRLNALVFGGFAAVALAIAVIGVAGVLVFSVSGRTREFGIRLALGAQPRNLLTTVIAQGALMAAVGIIAGAAFGYLLARLANSYIVDMRMPDTIPVVASAAVLLAAAVVASVLPAARAARIDVMDALRSE